MGKRAAVDEDVLCILDDEPAQLVQFGFVSEQADHAAATVNHHAVGRVPSVLVGEQPHVRRVGYPDADHVLLGYVVIQDDVVADPLDVNAARRATLDVKAGQRDAIRCHVDVGRRGERDSCDGQTICPGSFDGQTLFVDVEGRVGALRDDDVITRLGVVDGALNGREVPRHATGLAALVTARRGLIVDLFSVNRGRLDVSGVILILVGR